MKKALILINAYSKLKSAMNQPTRLKEELKKLGVEVDIRPNSIDTAMIIDGRPVSLLQDYDFVVYLDKDKYTSALLEKSGLRLFNRHEAVLICDDKMDTHIRLTSQGINMPDTIPGLLCYDKDASVQEAKDRIKLIEERLGYPCVIKESYGSLGNKVYCAENKDQLLILMEKVKLKAHLFQNMISTSRGRDVRIIVIGGKAICGMERTSQSDFRSNIELGGRAKPFNMTQPFIEMAERLPIFNDYCGIDLLFGENGEPIVCELTPMHFWCVESITGIEILTYMQHI